MPRAHPAHAYVGLSYCPGSTLPCTAPSLCKRGQVKTASRSPTGSAQSRRFYRLLSLPTPCTHRLSKNSQYRHVLQRQGSAFKLGPAQIGLQLIDKTVENLSCACLLVSVLSIKGLDTNMTLHSLLLCDDLFLPILICGLCYLCQDFTWR